MKFLFILFFTIPFLLFAQQEQYSRVRIELSSESNLHDIAKLGLCVDHGIHQKHKFLITELSASEIKTLSEHGIVYQVLVKDVVSSLHNNHKLALTHCDQQTSNTDLIIPEHFEYGSMSGYYTYQEMLEQLDSMRSMYPNLITVKDSLPEVDGVSTSHEGRPIWMVKVSNNADVDENEPEMIYTAIHHAREPGSLTQTIFYLWYLLENYGADEQVTAILNNTELYFVPMLNPDGYVYNETINPNGGGFWRKNRRDNGDGTFGVDLNRNYPYEWAYDDVGSSPDPSSETYRGPSAGSEPEIKLVMNFVDNHNFKFALNYHTFGGLLIYPWGFSDSFTPDSLEYIAFGEHMVSKNGYTKGTGSETVGYTVNGDSDDWYYGDTTQREAIYSMTPEAGNSFWPAQNEIIPFCNDNLYPNLWMASYLLNYARAELNYNAALNNLNPISIDVDLKRLGLMDSMDFTVGFQNYSILQVNNVSSPIAFSNLDHLEDTNFTMQIEMDASAINHNDTIRLELFVDNGFYKDIYPLEFIYQDLTMVNISYSDDGVSLGLWNTTGSWGIDNSIYKSEFSSIGDSPNGNYSNLVSSSITLDTILDLETSNEAFVEMDINVDIENNFDYVQLIAHSETDNQDYPLCGILTNDGSTYQKENEALYDGNSGGWQAEKVSLEDLFGHKITLRFEFVSDPFQNGRGFNFDNFKVVINNEPLGENELLEETISVSPNPTSNILFIEGLNDGKHSIEIFDYTGKSVLKQDLLGNKIDMSLFKPGVYFLKINKRVIKVVKQ